MSRVNKVGRPRKYATPELSRIAKLKASRKWSRTMPQRVKAYKEEYYKQNRPAQLKKARQNYIKKESEVGRVYDYIQSYSKKP